MAEDNLGDDFDFKAFHDQVIATGNVSLPMLERVIDLWIEEHPSDTN